jgi:sugar phosphate isomerase/epimerase
MARLPIALQLYSVRHECEKDLPGTLRAVAEMGYEGVEFAGFYGRTAQELKRLLDEVGLPCVGSHTPWAALQGDALAQTVEFNRILGNRFLIVPGLPKERTATRAAWLETAEMFNTLAAQLAPEGMRIGYHNHFHEFTPLEGELPWDTFFGHTRQDVIMQLDTGNAVHGGGDPATFLRRYPGRALSVHLKEHSASYDTALIGEGEIRWQEIFELCETVGGTQVYVVEQESYRLPPLECVAQCLQNLRKMGK